MEALVGRSSKADRNTTPTITHRDSLIRGSIVIRNSQPPTPNYQRGNSVQGPMDLFADLRYALRLLRRTPVFTIAAIGTLALGIGANTTIFSLVQTVLLHPLPYQNPDQVVIVWEDASRAGFSRNTPAPGNFNDWRRSNRSFTDMAATRGPIGSLTK